MIDKSLELIFTARLDKNYEEKLRQAAEKLRQDIGRPIDIKINADEEAKVYQLVLKTTNALNQQVTTTYQLDVVTGKVAKVHGTIVDNLEKQNILTESFRIKQQQLSNQVDRFVKLNKEYIDKGGLSQEYANLEQAIKKIDPTSKDFNNILATQRLRFQELNKEVDIYKKQADEATRFTTIFGERILEAGKKFITWYVIGNVIVTVLRQIREGIAFVKELDKDLTQVSMLTGQTREETRDLALEYARLGAEMAKTVSEISKVNTELIRQGLSLEVARKRMETVLKFSATAAISAEESLRVITSSVNAMGEAAEKTSDVLLLAGAISASSAEEIGEAFTKTASSAKAVGVPLESLAAILATLVEVTQESPSSLGNSMKTLLARFNKINEETGELNEEINNVQKAFESVGITFVDLDGQIRPVHELMGDLGKIWDTLDKNTKMYIATQAAGVRQQNRFLAIMENFNRVLEIENQLMDAGGTTNLYYARYLNSVEAAANRSRVALEQLWIKTINSDVLKYFYNFTTAVITLIDKIGGLRIAIALLVFALMNVRKSTSAFLVNLSLLPAAFMQSIAMGRTFKETLQAIAVAFDLVKLKGIALQAVLTFGLSIAITGIIEGILSLAGAMDAARQKSEELLYTYQETVQQNNAYIKSLQELVSEYEYLSKKIPRTSEEQKRLNELQNEIANISPSVVQGYDEQGNAIIRLRDGVQGLIEELREANKLKAFELVAGGEDAFKVMKKDVNDAKKEIEDINRHITRLQGEPYWNKFTNSLQVSQFGIKQVKEEMERLRAEGKEGSEEFNNYAKILERNENEIENLNARIRELRGNIDAAADSFRPYLIAVLDSSEAFAKLNEEQKRFLYDYISTTEDFGTSWEEASGNIRRLIEIVSQASFQRFVSDIENINTQLENGTVNAEEYEREFNKIIVAMAELFGLDPDFLAEIFKRATPEAQSAADAVGEIETKLKELNDEFNNVTSSCDILSKALEELDKYGQLSAKTMMDIVNNHEDLIVPMLQGEIGLREALNQRIHELEDNALEIFREATMLKLQDSEVFFNEIVRGNRETWNQVIGMYGTDKDNFTTVAKAKIEIDNAVRRIVGEGWARIYGTTAEGIGRMISALEAHIQAFSGYTDNWARTSVAGAYAQISALRSLRSALNSLSSAMDTAISKINLAPVSLKKLESATKSAAKSASKSLKDPYEEWLKEAERVANNVIKLMQDAWRKQKKIALAAIDEERKALEKAHKERMKQLDEEYNRMADLIDQRIRAIEDVEDEEDFQRELARLMEERGEIERQIAKLSLDDSYEARAKREELEKDLANKIEQINELTRKRNKELRVQELNDQKNALQEELEAKKAQQEAMHEAEKERLERIREETAYHYDELINNERYFAQIREDIISGNIKNIQAKLQDFINNFKKINQDAAYEMGVSYQELLNLMDRAAAAKKDITDITRTSTGTPGKPSSPPPSSGTTSVYTVKSGDTLSAIASKLLGSANRWKEIYDLNKALIDAEAKRRKLSAPYYNWIFPGQKLVIPKRHEGGIIDGCSSRIVNKDSRDLWDLFSKDLKPDEVLIKALKNEVVLNPNIALPQFQKNMVSAMGAVTNQSTNSMVNNINFNISANATEADAKKLAKMTLAEIYRIQERMGRRS